MATHKELVAEGNRLDLSLNIIQRMIADKTTIPEQMTLIQGTAMVKMARLKALTAAIARDCDGCAHPKDRHVSGTAKCLFMASGDRCQCQEWIVNV